MTKEEILEEFDNWFPGADDKDVRDFLSQKLDEYALAMVGEDEGCWYEEGTCGKRAPSCKGCQFTKCKQEIRDRINSK